MRACGVAAVCHIHSDLARDNFSKLMREAPQLVSFQPERVASGGSGGSAAAAEGRWCVLNAALTDPRAQQTAKPAASGVGAPAEVDGASCCAATETRARNGEI